MIFSFKIVKATLFPINISTLFKCKRLGPLPFSQCMIFFPWNEALREGYKNIRNYMTSYCALRHLLKSKVILLLHSFSPQNSPLPCLICQENKLLLLRAQCKQGMMTMYYNCKNQKKWLVNINICLELGTYSSFIPHLKLYPQKFEQSMPVD